MTDDHVCVPVVDADGQVLGHARVSPNLGERGQRAVVSVVQAAHRLMVEEVAADPVVVEECGRRQAAAIARIRARVRARDEPG